MKREYISSSPAQTKKLGEKFAREISKAKLKKSAFVVGLTGKLGGGKTTFLQGFAKGLGIKQKILSPTFVIIKKFSIFLDRAKRETPRRVAFQFSNFYHIDCYRIKRPKELLDLGFKEIISNPQDIVAIEWSDRIKKIMPKNSIWINFDFINIRKRKILFEILC